MNRSTLRPGYRWVSLTLLVSLVCTFALHGAPPPIASAQVLITNPGSPYTQNFDTLANTGTSNPWSDNATLEGWYATRQTGGAFTAYRADNGAGNTGALYSFGSTSSSERALGSIASGTPGNIAFGVRLRNDTGATITDLVVSYTGEQWRNGNNTAQHRLDVAYQTGTNLTNPLAGTWTDVDVLDFTGPITGSTATALDGNAAANRVAIAATIVLNPALAPGQEVMLRWFDPNDASNDHGLAIDDLTITANSSAGNAPIVAACPATLTTNEGVATSTGLSARDADGVVVSATITSTPVSGISLIDFAPAAGAGLTATVTLSVADNVAPGTYNVVVQFANNDSAPQTTDCTVAVTVNPPAGSCPAPPATLRAIATIQGGGLLSPFNGQTTSVQGVVVGDFQGASGLNGFFIQDPIGDGDPATSEGLFVYIPPTNSRSNIDVNVGDLVQVTGTVDEFGDPATGRSLTEIDTVTELTICGTTDPLLPASVTLPETTEGDLERYEGMYITIPHTMTVSQNFFQGRFGQVTLAAGGRLYNPTNQFAPNSPQALALADENARRLLVLDDGSSAQNPNPIPYIGADDTLRAGDTVSNLSGILDFGAINANSPPTRDFRLHPTTAPIFTRVNARPAAPDPVEGNLTVASFNVLNYFTTIDQTGAACFPSGTRSDCRGADSATEFQRQADKIVAAISTMNADVVGLMEIENNGETAVNDLVSRLNSVMGADTYAAIADPEGFQSLPGGDDAIKVALIYKPASVTPVGAAVASASSAFANARAPLAQTFSLADDDSVSFTVIVNHFKSKSCSGASGANRDQGDGQGCFNADRVRQAQALLAFIAELQAATDDDDVLVIGDLNAYNQEDPVRTLTNGGLVNELSRWVGATPYSYIFDGLAGALDHALSTPGLSIQVTGATEWHINTDEPSVIDYNTEFKPQDLYAPHAYRSADHDPVIVGLNLSNDPVNQPIGARCPATLTTFTGAATTAQLSARDPDGAVVSAAITSTPVSGISLTNLIPAAAAGQTASVTLEVGANAAPGTSAVTVQFANHDSAPQTASCTIAVTVNLRYTIYMALVQR